MRVNSSVYFGLLLLVGFALVTSGCIKSYKSDPPLSFYEFPYDSPDGKAWPVSEILLPETSKKYGMTSDIEVAYVEFNPDAKKTMLFVHGLGSYMKVWRYQITTFAEKGYRVLALDLPGYGKSDKPATYPYTMEAQADAVREFAALKGCDKPVLIGHSMGGQTSLSYAIRYPDQLSALVLTAPAGFEKFSRRDKAWFKSVYSIHLIKSVPEYGLWGSIRRYNFYRWKPEFEWLIEERVRVINTKEFESYAYANVRAVEGLANNDFVRLNLDKIKIPTLIIHGDKDRLIPNPYMHGGRPQDIMEYGHQNIKGSQLSTLKNCGHMVQMDCWEDYNQKVGEFVESL